MKVSKIWGPSLKLPLWESYKNADSGLAEVGWGLGFHILTISQVRRYCSSYIILLRGNSFDNHYVVSPVISKSCLLLFLLSHSLVLSYAQLCLTLCDPLDCSTPGSSVHGIFQTRILEWVAISYSGNLSDPGIEPASLVSPTLAVRFFTMLW